MRCEGGESSASNSESQKGVGRFCFEKPSTHSNKIESRFHLSCHGSTGPPILPCDRWLLVLELHVLLHYLPVSLSLAGGFLMARQNRRDIFDPNEVGAFHAVQRTVRRAWLCGLDPVSGKSFEHRRTWIQNRLQELAASFGIDCLSFAVMVNHVHVILRNRPDVVAGWNT